MSKEAEAERGEVTCRTTPSWAAQRHDGNPGALLGAQVGARVLCSLWSLVLSRRLKYLLLEVKALFKALSFNVF